MTDFQGRIYAEVEGRRFPIQRLQALRLALFDLEARREGEALDFELAFVRNEHVFRLSVRGTFAAAEPVGERSAVIALVASAETLERLRTAVDWMKSDEPFPRTALRNLGGQHAQRSGERKSRARGVRIAALALACAALGSYVVHAAAFNLDVPADSAFVAADTHTVDVDGLDPALVGRWVDVRFERRSFSNGLDLRL